MSDSFRMKNVEMDMETFFLFRDGQIAIDTDAPISEAERDHFIQTCDLFEMLESLRPPFAHRGYSVWHYHKQPDRLGMMLCDSAEFFSHVQIVTINKLFDKNLIDLLDPLPIEENALIDVLNV